MQTEFEEDHNSLEKSINRFMKTQFSWVKKIDIDKENFLQNKQSKSKFKNYDVYVGVSREDLPFLKQNKDALDTAEEQLTLLFNALIKDSGNISVNIIPKVIE
jgi:hypothetical protein